MWRFVMGAAPPPPYKKQKLVIGKVILYEVNKRQRTFIQSWTSRRPWLRYEKATNMMFCDMCIKHDVTSKLDFICYRLSNHEITLYQGISIITNI